MKINKCFCNHCGIELDKTDYPDAVIELGSNYCRGKYIDSDLCKNCIDELFSIINNFCSVQKGEVNND